MDMKSFSIVVAVDKKFGIAKDGKLPWQLEADLKYFKEITKGNIHNNKIKARVVEGIDFNSDGIIDDIEFRE